MEDYLLELVLYNEVAWADGKFTPAELKAFASFVPRAMSDEVFRKWQESTEFWGSKSEEEYLNYLEECYEKTSKKDQRWKKKVLKSMIKVARADRRIPDEELSVISEIADKIGAQKECSKQFMKEFGYDPFPAPH